MLAVRDALLTRWAGKTVVVVSHMMPTRAILADAKGLDYAAWPRLTIPTASLSLIDFAADGRATVGWVGYKPDGLSVRRAFPQAFV